MPDRVDVPLYDRNLREELALTARLIIAANGSRSPLGRREPRWVTRFTDSPDAGDGHA